ncbi:DJ-1/PfpI family protein [Curtobacterium sp. BRD11]|uniref:DJ-1/PfpI family protein n=1 Tax=Curtobacterium sp. BRD11 TaxID=2962581 RepID=UPI0028823646|nr:DJ-1/PfpI family protein [Curtobacterium sp. BRD11]MDT0212146.1 DJ-1/PfpI family protein [Curtobacterium sp. BRD11]
MSRPVRFVALLFPNVTQLDLTGPVQLFSRLPGATIDLAWHDREPVGTDAGFAIMPTVTFDEAPQADVLMVPGGQGAFDLLETIGAVPEQARVVRDVRIITGGGVTSGVDFALTVAAEVDDDAAARAVQLAVEYDPHPPFDAGSPTRPEADAEQVRRAVADARRSRGPVVSRAASRLGLASC